MSHSLGPSCRHSSMFLILQHRVVPRRSSKETSKEESSFKEKLHKKKNRFLTERQVAWMIYEYFKVSDTDESVWDLDEILKVELKNDNVQSFKYAMGRNHHHDQGGTRRGNSGYYILPSALSVRAAKNNCCLCTFKIPFKRANRETTPNFQKWWSRFWSSKFGRSISLLVKYNLKCSLWRCCSQEQV